MQIKIFTMVKDENDIVTDWVFYHGSIFGFSNIYIIDNFSTDGTYEQLLKLKALGIHITRKEDYSKKGDYMTMYYNKYCDPEDIAYPIDIDEFIVYYDKPNNTILVDKKTILRYLTNLPDAEIYKTNYIQATPNQDAPNGYKRAAAECQWGFYDGNYGIKAKSFMKKKLYHGKIDHGNHIPINNYFMTDLCLIHFHVRNLEQIRKKIYSNITGFGYNADNLQALKDLMKHNPLCSGNHHIIKQIQILENTHSLSCHHYNQDSISLKPLNKFIQKLKL